MAKEKQKRKYTVRHFMMIDGVKTEIDPTKTDLPDRCKLALAYMTTGKEHVLVDKA